MLPPGLRLFVFLKFSPWLTLHARPLPNCLQEYPDRSEKQRHEQEDDDLPVLRRLLDQSQFVLRGPAKEHAPSPVKDDEREPKREEGFDDLRHPIQQRRESANLANPSPDSRDH